MPQKNGGRGRDQNSFRYEILRHYGILSTSGRGWTRELNLIRWNNRKPKYDLRDWNPDHDKMSKGITLTEEEMMVLMSLMEENQIGFTEEVETDTVSPYEEKDIVSSQEEKDVVSSYKDPDKDLSYEEPDKASPYMETDIVSSQEEPDRVSPYFESKAAEEKAYTESEISGETGTRDFAGELYEAETA